MTITVNIMSYNHINFFHCFADEEACLNSRHMCDPNARSLRDSLCNLSLSFVGGHRTSLQLSNKSAGGSVMQV